MIPISQSIDHRCNTVRHATYGKTRKHMQEVRLVGRTNQIPFLFVLFGALTRK
jgi:hypothetical protein